MKPRFQVRTDGPPFRVVDNEIRGETVGSYKTFTGALRFANDLNTGKRRLSGVVGKRTPREVE